VKSSTAATEVVLVGAGHAHVQVLRRLAMAPWPSARVTLVVDEPLALYSGMVPGLVAGQYTRDELSIDAHVLARRAGVRVIYARATRVDAAARLVHVEGRPPVFFDIASLNVGSTVAGAGVEGVAEHTLATRPLSRFVRGVDALGAGGPKRVTVVGGGAAGVELAAALRARGHALTLVDGAPALAMGGGAGWSARVARALAARGVAVRLGARVVRVTEAAIEVEGGEPIAHDAVVWAAGAAPPPLCAASELPKDPRGYVLTDRWLRVLDHPQLFAVGDCAVQDEARWVPRAGVYAVRSGGVLADNLEATLCGWPLRAYRPQREFLALLNLGDGTALGRRGALAAEGAWMFRLKDRIDRRFIEGFRALEGSGRPRAGWAPMAGADAMVCGGCAAKLGQTALDLALGSLASTEDPSVVLGVADRDDVSVTRSPGGDLVVSNVDGFRAFCDDPFLVGQVAAVNAMSDLWAKGIAPRHALALVTVPQPAGGGPGEAATARELAEVLAGARAALGPVGASLVGGHTMAGPELSVGFAVLGYAEASHRLATRAGLRVGDRLLLTKALGTGVLLRADALGLVSGEDALALRRALCQSNEAAMGVMTRSGASEATDVTGFGLLGHLGALCLAGGVGAELWLERLVALPGAAGVVAAGVRSTFYEENARALRAARVAADAATHPLFELIVDPQTSGGLLFGVAADAADAALAELVAGGHAAALIGEVVAAPEGEAGVVSVLARPEPGSGGRSARPRSEVVR
jgi:selenide,water dikinase